MKETFLKGQLQMLNEGFIVEGNEVVGLLDKSQQIVNPVTLQSVLKSEFNTPG